MPKCKYKYNPGFAEKIPVEIPLDCKEQSTDNGEFCIFHDKKYFEEHEQKAAKSFEDKVRKSISQKEKEPLVCLGYYLPYIEFANLLEEKTFVQTVYFNGATFYKNADFRGLTFSEEANFYKAQFNDTAWFSDAHFNGKVDFSEAKFKEQQLAFFSNAQFNGEAYFYKAQFNGEAYFSEAKFKEQQVVSFNYTQFNGEANFSNAKFNGEANFRSATFTERANFVGAKFSKEAKANFEDAKFLDEVYFRDNGFKGKTFFRNVTFEHQDKVKFDNNDLSRVSFADSDITRIRFRDGITWGIGKKAFTIIEEEWLADKGQKENELEKVSLELALSVYRNLRENYEFRLRYDDAGEFFIKEMELKRKYREIRTENGTKTKRNDWFRENFSLTGLYYRLSRYGESISRPVLIGAITVILSTLLWVTQSDPTLEPHFPPTVETDSTSTFVGFREIYNGTHLLKSFERSFADFLPLLPAGDFKVGIIDFIIKIVGGALTFGLLIIALRRKFERKYTR